MSITSQLRRPSDPTCLAAGVLLLLLGGIYSFLNLIRMGADYQPLYLTSRSMLNHENIYDYATYHRYFDAYQFTMQPGMFYPPSSGLVTLPLSALPYRIASALLFALFLGAVVYATKTLLEVIAPQANRYFWMTASGLILLTACMRWGFHTFQGAPLVYSATALMVAALLRSQYKWAFALTCLVICWKPSVALPLFGLLLLFRQYKSAAGAIVVLIVINALGFALMGAGAYADYKTNLARVEAFGMWNTPSPWEPISIARWDWTYLIYGVTGKLALARAASALMAISALAWLTRQWFQMKLRTPNMETIAIFLLALICISTLWMYHHNYDIVPILVPLLMLWQRRETFPLPRWAWWLLAPMTLYILFCPVAQLESLLMRFFGPHIAYAFRMAGVVVTSLACIAALGLVNHYAARMRSQPPPS